MIKCECGFEFSGPGEFRNCEVKINKDHKTIIVCPNCKMKYENKK